MTTTLAPIRLIMVTGDNHNKFYNMTPDGTEFIAEWGRVGVTSASKRYPLHKWQSTYNEKTKKGYKDVTALVKTSTKKSGFGSIADNQVQALMTKLQAYAGKSVQDNYTISSDAVTQAQVTEAQGFVNELTSLAVIGSDNTKLNRLLLDLYAVIPRRMKKVQDHLLKGPIKTSDDLQVFRTIVDTEQQTLDVMAGQVQMQGADVTDDDSKTILDALGITVSVGTPQDVDIVKKFMGPDAHEFRAVYVVHHAASRTRYASWKDTASHKREELFWHGSRNENWISILQSGLKIRPSNAVLTGAMFGHGIYFADKYRKSAGYTSLSGSYWARGSARTAFLALMNVHVGRTFDVTRHTSDMMSLNWNKLRSKGDYHSLFAKGGYDLRNNEYIVYDDAQSTIHYLIEVGN